ncbi:MAG TPA: glycogen-binding domain-containing protein, partial [Candidatus Cloacimonadota bacterium]|nr:glycogen-binding domain-containing protein [Candidatus Cloacimonadota bacterium]
MPLQRFSYAPLTAGMHTVGITGDFSGWEIMDLEENAGIYNLFLDLAPGLYRYKLIVDGVWMADPANPDREPDPYGGFNSILEISE